MAVTEIIISAARTFYAPVGEPEVADTVVAGGSWGGNWTQLGLTATPLSAAYETEETEADVQEYLAPAKRKKTSENFMLETTLAEFTLDNMQLGTQGTVVESQAGVGQPGKEDLEVGGVSVLDELMWGFEGLYNEESGTPFPVRLYVWRATAKLNGALEFGKTTQTGIPLQIKGLAQDASGSLFKITRITAEALP